MSRIQTKISLRHLSTSLGLLPEVIKYYSSKWSLTNLKPLEYTNASKNFVFEAFQASSASRVVLKFNPSVAEAKLESAALRFYDGNGSVKLLDSDTKKGVLLRSYAFFPSLSSLFPHKDDESVLAAISVIKKLHSKPLLTTDVVFPNIEDLLTGLKNNNIIPTSHIERAKAISQSLITTQGHKVLLHGDLHHGNILSDGRYGWIAIDPKGVIGEPAYEVGAFIRNPMPKIIADNCNFSKIILRRIGIFSECLNIDIERIELWTYIQSVLAACWAVEDNCEWKQWIDCVEFISKNIFDKDQIIIDFGRKNELKSDIQDLLKQDLQLDLSESKIILDSMGNTNKSTDESTVIGDARNLDNHD